ncbi:uncharacterized protein LODBEIA_P23730 [Lodderomyces beijingensis]|uniref:RRM domain-containing protein n=1 Tax=Lodderomyces beijingensis TaxID=1775926 RepID=A0ABP0ZJU8_9ASCO
MSEVSEEVRAATKPVIEERVYVGNVDYKATEEEVKELFKDLKVTEVEIPFKERTRNDETFKLHLGFAFVQFESKEEADKAIAEYNGKRLQRRNIFLKKAVPPPTEEERKVKNEAFKAKREELQKTRKQKKEEAAAAKKQAKEGAAGDNSDAKDESSKSKSPSSKAAPDGEKSKDTVFVTNLEYKVNAKVLSKVFEELKPKWIHVPVRRVHQKTPEGAPKRRPLNKGIAFVKFADEETQKRAVAEFNGKDVKGREMIVDFAVNSKVPEKGTDDTGDEENGENGDANGEDSVATENGN